MTTKQMLGYLNSGPDIGTRVKIIEQPRYKRYSLIGMVGTVCSTYCNKIAVKVDGVFNDSSGRGYFYFEPGELLYVDEFVENNKMEENTMVVNVKPVTNYLNSVKIMFMDDHVLAKNIYANYDPDVKVDDLVVVQPAHHPITLARVVEVVDRNDYETTREVVAKVDTSAYSDRMKTRQLAAELKAKMEERAQKLQDVALYKMLAENDSEMQDLLNRYQSLPNV